MSGDLGWLERIRVYRAAKRYARRLPKQLEADYGASREYTKSQIDAALSKRNLNPKYAPVVYLRFLNSDEYNRARREIDAALPSMTVQLIFLAFLGNRKPPDQNDKMWDTYLGGNGGDGAGGKYSEAGWYTDGDGYDGGGDGGD